MDPEITRYDNYPQHPLYGVPVVVLEAARKELSDALDDLGSIIGTDMIEPVADAIVMAILEAQQQFAETRVMIKQAKDAK